MAVRSNCTVAFLAFASWMLLLVQINNDDDADEKDVAVTVVTGAAIAIPEDDSDTIIQYSTTTHGSIFPYNAYILLIKINEYRK